MSFRLIRQDALCRAARDLHLYRVDPLTEDQTAEFWRKLGVLELPAADDVDGVSEFLICFLSSAKKCFEQVRDERRKAAEKHREYLVDLKRKFKGKAASSDVF